MLYVPTNASDMRTAKRVADLGRRGSCRPAYMVSRHPESHWRDICLRNESLDIRKLWPSLLVLNLVVRMKPNGFKTWS